MELQHVETPQGSLDGLQLGVGGWDEDIGVHRVAYVALQESDRFDPDAPLRSTPRVC